MTSAARRMVMCRSVAGVRRWQACDRHRTSTPYGPMECMLGGKSYESEMGVVYLVQIASRTEGSSVGRYIMMPTQEKRSSGTLE